MFEADHLREECLAAVTNEDTPQRAVREILARALERPAEVLGVLGEPRRAEIQTLHRSPELTILNVIWGPGMTLMPHNHNMWAAIGIYTGREDNILWRRLRDDPEGRIEAAGAKAIGVGEVLPLGRDIIHSVTNPLGRLTGAIHIYGGEFFETPRSQWDPEHLREQRFDVDGARAIFEASNRLLDPAP